MIAQLARIPIAHRGLHDLQSGRIENSLSAFRAAIEAGYAIELDVRPSADGEAMVFHDRTLERLTAGTGLFTALTAEQLERTKLSGSAEMIPTLAQVLAVVRGRVPLLIEIKSDGLTPTVLSARVAALLSSYRGEAAVQSFDPHVVQWFSSHAPVIPRGLLAARQKDLLTPAVFAAQFLAYNIWALPSFGSTVARQLGLPLLAWTICDEPTRALSALHADNIIFEGFRPPIPHGK